MLRLVEAFSSIQGESTHAGRPCFFLRLAGCNLRCSYCDTLYAQEEQSGKGTAVEELVSLVEKSELPLVEITGGEPLIHPETPQLCAALLKRNLEVLLETNGSLSIAGIPREVRKILDCKLPSSGMSARNLFSNYDLLCPHDEVKFVVGSHEDFAFAESVITKYSLRRKTANLLFSPVWGKVSFSDLADWVLHSHSGARMQIQMHKIIWGERQGV